jgi:hypothetical protein
MAQQAKPGSGRIVPGVPGCRVSAKPGVGDKRIVVGVDKNDAIISRLMLLEIAHLDIFPFFKCADRKKLIIYVPP